MKVERGEQSCPKCAGKLLHVERGGMTVELCSACRGLWLDPGELTVMLELYRRLDTDAGGASGVFCLRCSDIEMRELRFPGTEVELDCCPRCQGVWLDDGELHLLRERVAELVGSGEAEDGRSLSERAAALLSEAEVAGEQRFSCPKCKAKLWHVEREGEVVEVCSGCNGMWFDAGELTLMLGFYRRIETERGKPSYVACIRCGDGLVELPFPETTVDVDVCPECRGVWLDAGELEALKKDLAKFMPSEQASFSDRAAQILDDLDRGAVARAACPRCGERLQPDGEGGARVERCVGCGGTWLDSGDLTRVLGVARKVRAKDGGSSELACVRCPGQSMVELPYPGTPVPIDLCPDCRGVWLDSGELAALRAAVQPTP